MNEIDKMAAKDAAKVFLFIMTVGAVVYACLLPIARHFDRKAEQERLAAPCSEFRDGTVGDMPVRCLPWDVR